MFYYGQADGNKTQWKKYLNGWEMFFAFLIFIQNALFNSTFYMLWNVIGFCRENEQNSRGLGVQFWFIWFLEQSLWTLISHVDRDHWIR